jgi:uncharacterized protein (DUF1015 family)
MAEIVPFSGLRYAADRIGDLAAVLSPPYDVIGERARVELEARHPQNVVRLELPRGDGDARYGGAAKLLSAWTAEGLLRREERPAYYVYEQRFTWEKTAYMRRGFFAAVRLEPFDKRVVLPHEKTLSGPKEDRRKLLLATRTQLSPIFGLYRDPDGAAEEVLAAAMAGPPAVDATTGDGTRHRLWVLTEPAPIERLTEIVRAKQILIADGHHRYETLLGTQTELRNDQAMVFLARAEDPGLLVLPTHRLVHDLDGFDFSALCASAKAAFDIVGGNESTADAIEARLARERGGPNGTGGNKVVFAVRVPGEATTSWFTLKSFVDLSALGPPSLRKLDVTVLHGVILGPLLGIDAAALASQSNLTYAHDTAEALRQVAASEAQVAFFMNPTRIDQVLTACEAGFVLPQKSTYFQPKVGTGLVFYPLDGPAPGSPAR